jgi:hypothetical protein
VQKKTFQKLRKIQNEFRNLNMHLICVALRLQDLSPKIRTKMSILCSRVSLDDYQLKVRNLLRNSKYRDEITQLPKGKFVFPELDLMLSVQPFKQEGTPIQLKQPTAPQQKKLNVLQRIVFSINSVLFPSANVPKTQPQRATRNLTHVSTETRESTQDSNSFFKSEEDSLSEEEKDLREIEEEWIE